MQKKLRNDGLIHLNGRKISLQKPIVMGILNLTPDSFYSGSRSGLDDLCHKAEGMMKAGATILDLGGQSTRPGSKRISPEEEISRVVPAIDLLMKEFPESLISIDTFYSAVAKAAVTSGACMVNDISGGQIDPEMFASLAGLGVPYVLTHIQGEPQTMQDHPHYEDVVQEVSDYFTQKTAELRALGVHDIILDPGFGFGKNKEHNLSLLAHLERFTSTDMPVLVGFSRKKTIRDLLGVSSEEALNGTTVMNTIALMKGATILRVHDPLEAMQACILTEAVRSAH